MTDLGKDVNVSHTVPSAPPSFEYGLPEQKISLTALHTTSPGSHSGGTLPRNPVHGYQHFHHPSQPYSTVSRTMYTPYPHPLPHQSEYIPGQMSTEFPDGNVTIGFHQPPPGNLGFMPPPYPPLTQSGGPPVGGHQFSGPITVGYSRIHPPHESHSSHHPHHQYQPSFSRSHEQQFPPTSHTHTTTSPPVIDARPSNTEVYNATTVSSSSQSVSNAYKRRRGLIAVSCFTGLILLIILIVFSL